MINKDAYQFYCENTSKSIRSVTEDFIGAYGLDTELFNHFRLKFTNLHKELKSFQKQYDIDTWKTLFCPLRKRPRIHANTSIFQF